MRGGEQARSLDPRKGEIGIKLLLTSVLSGGDMRMKTCFLIMKNVAEELFVMVKGSFAFSLQPHTFHQGTAGWGYDKSCS